MATTTYILDDSDEAGLRRLMVKVSFALQAIQWRKLMTQYDDLNAALDAEGADVTAILAELASDVASIQDLQAQLAAALANQAPDLAPLLAKVQAQTAALAAQLPPPAPPVT